MIPTLNIGMIPALIWSVLAGKQSDFGNRIAFFYRPRLMASHPELLFAPLCAVGIFGVVKGPESVGVFFLAHVILIWLTWYAGVRFRAARSQLSDLAWGWIAVGLNCMRGLTWSIFALVQLDFATPWLDALLLLLILGASWTSLGFATWVPGLSAFPITALGPTALFLLGLPNTGAHLMGILLLLAIPMIVSNAFATGHVIMSAERLVRRNQALSHRLTLERDRAQAGNRAKTAFLATMGHELKTPLNAMIGFSEIIALEQHAKLPEIYKTYLTDIITAGRHLVDVVNDVLAMARLEAGRYVLSVTAVDLCEIAKGVVRVMRIDADQSDVRLELTMPEFLIVEVDSKAVRQILFNLISNAIKFSEPNSVVRVNLSQAQDHAVIAVEDQGIGIASGDVERVLRPFEQAESPMARHHSGIGLGLPISLGLIELHGGSLKVDSKLGAGTVMTVQLPITAADALPTAEVAE
jgi:signal transduction histidine kinase